MTLRIGLAAGLLAMLHVVVYPRTSTVGGRERYFLRVPNEKNVATTRIEFRVPAGVRVSSFAEVPGWKLDVLTDSAGAITGAVWTGTLGVKRFVELPFTATNPKADSVIAWPAYQTYADGERVEWTGAPESKTPASTTRLEDPASTAAPRADGVTPWVAWLALAVALVGLGFAIRRPARSA